MRKIFFWFKNARCGALPQSLMPSATAVIIMAGTEGFSWKLAVLAVIGVGFAHLAFNLLDDFFDYISHQTGYRNTLKRSGFRAYTAKCPYLTSKEASLKELAAAIAVFGAVAGICGLIIFYFRGWPIAAIVGVTVFLGYFYSGKPLRLSYHGLGEPVIGIIFGVLNMAGTALAASGNLSWEIIIIGVIMGFLVTNILYTHSVLDYHADQSVGKKTMAAFFKTDNGRLRASGVMLFTPYILLFFGIFTGWLSPLYLLVLAALPISIELYKSMRQYRMHPELHVKWKKWYGPCGNWKVICENDLDWFLQRWLLARNLVTLTAIICCIVSVILKAVNHT